MPIHRLNHAVLFVSDVAISKAFYQDVLGFTEVDMGGPIQGAAFLRAPGSHNDHDLGLFEARGAAQSLAGRGTVGLYHLAWEVDTLGELERLSGRLAGAGALVGATDHSTTKALYGRDPDGLEFEVCWLVPAELIDDAMLSGRSRNRPLDLAREIERFGSETRGGVGVSVEP